MALVKVLGAIDLASSIAFLIIIFGITPYPQFILFCAGLLLIKSLFLIRGDVLSFVDLLSSISLILLIFFALPIAVLWIFTFLLLAKGFVSFL